jgi:hypothetical protein
VLLILARMTGNGLRLPDWLAVFFLWRLAGTAILLVASSLDERHASRRVPQREQEHRLGPGGASVAAEPKPSLRYTGGKMSHAGAARLLNGVHAMAVAWSEVQGFIETAYNQNGIIERADVVDLAYDANANDDVIDAIDVIGSRVFNSVEDAHRFLSSQNAVTD